VGLEQSTVQVKGRRPPVCPCEDIVSGTGLNEMLQRDYRKKMVTSNTRDKSNIAMLRTNDTPNGGHPTTYVIQNAQTSYN